MDQPELGCAACAELREALKTISGQNTELASENAALNHQLRRAGQAEMALRQKLKERDDSDDTDEDAVIRTIIDTWKRKLGHPKSKAPKTGKRWKVVKDALRNHSVEDVLEAIDGLALLPYVGKGRKATGFEKERFDDLEHCLGDEVKVARFRGYAQRAVAAADAEAAVLDPHPLYDTWVSVRALEGEWSCLVLDAICRLEMAKAEGKAA